MVAGFDEATRVAELLSGARLVVVGAHVDPDGDAVGSMLGLVLACRKLGVEAVAVSASAEPVPATYAFLPGADLVRTPDAVDDPDVFVALDSPSLARLGAAQTLAKSATKLIVIDHHPDNAGFGDISLVDPTASSVGAMIWRMLDVLGVEPDADIATCLYTALVTDTGRFSYSNTTPRSLSTAADMLSYGVDVRRVFTEVYESRSAGALALVGRALERITTLNGGSIAYSWVDERDFAETCVTKAETENLIDEVRALRGVSVVFLMKRSGGAVRVSLRAKGDTDVGSVARMFGGGGHRAAAGFTYEGSSDQLLDILVPAIRKVLE